MASRAYRSERRRADAAATREQIRRAATRLFVEQGYAATSLRQVAAAAGVAERTLYAAFASKFDLFHHALDVATVGDELPIPVRDRPEMVEPLTEPDASVALAAGTDYGVDLLERAGDLIWAGVEAAGADARLRALSDAGRHETRAVMLRFTKSLAERGALRPDLDAERAADVLFALSSPHLFRLLRRDAGWSTEQYRSWMHAITAEQLLGRPGPGGPPDRAAE